MMGQKKGKNIELIQFHQSYTYEDFMMGYKPTEQGFDLHYGDSASGQLSIQMSRFSSTVMR